MIALDRINNEQRDNLTISNFLEAFFPDLNETIHIRYFSAKKAPVGAKGIAQDLETTRLQLASNRTLQNILKSRNDKCGIYFVVNSGGAIDANIKRFNAFFMENDNLSIEEQHLALDHSPLKPSIRVETAKSVHSYWLIDGNCTEEEWRDIQVRLIDYFDGDNKIKNPSRCMRLPFFNHISYDGAEAIKKEVKVAEFDGTAKFTVQMMKDAFPEIKKPETEKPIKQIDSVTSVTSVTPSERLFEDWDSLNFELGLLIIQQGKRNNRGKYEMKCPVHNGVSDNSLFFDPKTRVICCMNKCSHESLLEAFGLPTQPLSSEKKTKRNPSELAVELAENVEFFVSQEDEPFACIDVNGHKENWIVDSKTFREWLGRAYYQKYKRVLSDNSLKDAISTLSGKAKYEGLKKQVFVRRAEYEGAIYIDLADEHRRTVKVTEEGWEVVSDCPVKFRQVAGQQALPIPERNGSLSEIDRFLNVKKEDLPLLKAWLVTALRINIPYPILVFSGQMNCGKSTSARVICQLIDPQSAELLSKPTNEEALFITCNNRLLVPFDNISYIDENLSDMLCKVSTGCAHTKRKNYTDIDEVILKAKNPVLLTGIGDLATREDFLSRCVVMELPRLKKRVDEASFWADYKKHLPVIFGGLLDAVAKSLKNLDSVKLENIDDLRMLDFARLGTSIESCLGLENKSFISSYKTNYSNINRVILDNNPVVIRLMYLMKDRAEWKGSPSALFDALNNPSDYINRKGFPQSVIGLSNALERLSQSLEAEGFEVERSREGGTGKKLVKIINHNFTASQSSQSSQNPKGQQDFDF